MAVGPAAKALQDRSTRVTPGRQSNFRALPGTDPVFFQRAHGCRYADVDGEEFVDFTLSMGAALWGYGDVAFKRAINEQVETLLAMSSGIAQSISEVELAEAVCDRVPGADWVRFGISGTEAVQLALRLARAHTGRPLFLRFEGHYHGWLDNVAGGAAPKESSGPPHPVRWDDDPGDTAGRSPYAFKESIMVPWNDAEALEAVLSKHGNQIAVVMMEAIMCNAGCCPPRPGYLERVRALCDQYGCLLMFDEVITGFRVHAGGAQALTGVTPDLATFGKALAGGLPLSAVAGRREVLQQLRDNRVLGGGTFNGFPLAMAAGAATMAKLADGRAYQRMDEQQAKLSSGLKAAAERHGHSLLVQGPRGVVFSSFVDRETAWTPADLVGADRTKEAAFRTNLKANGVLMAGGNRWMISPNHSDEDIEAALHAADLAMAAI